MLKRLVHNVWRGEMVKYHAMVQMLLFEHYFNFSLKRVPVYIISSI